MCHSPPSVLFQIGCWSECIRSSHSELLSVAIEPFLAELFSERIAKEENKQVFSSTTPFSGVVQSAGFSTTIAGGHYSTVTFDELVAACKGAGLMTQKIPEQLVIHGEALPRNATMKILKFELRDQYAELPWP